MRPIYDAKFRCEICKRMSPPSRETVTEISRAKGISRKTLYSWRHLWKREGVFCLEFVYRPALRIQNTGADQLVAGYNLIWFGLMNH